MLGWGRIESEVRADMVLGRAELPRCLVSSADSREQSVVQLSDEAQAEGQFVEELDSTNK